MLEPLENLPTGVIGFRAVGTVEPDDYRKILDPAIDAAEGGVRFVYVVGDDFDRYSLGAIWEDVKLGATHTPRSWKRIAFVTGHEWLGSATKIFSPLVPGEVKVFPPDQEAAAIAWAAAGDD
jgi:hypothetical protein